MKNFITALLIVAAWMAHAQTKVTETARVATQQFLELAFDFADEIVIKTWDKNEVYVEVSVSIMDGEYDHIFSLDKRVSAESIQISMDRDMWKLIDQKDGECHFYSTIDYTVYMPASMELEASTISGDYLLETYSKRLLLKTISGDIDISVAPGSGVDFKAKTLSGEIYSDLEIEFTEGKGGLHQVVGMNVTGKVNRGGTPMKLETISGNIYLRRG